MQTHTTPLVRAAGIEVAQARVVAGLAVAVTLLATVAAPLPHGAVINPSVPAAVIDRLGRGAGGGGGR